MKRTPTTTETGRPSQFFVRKDGLFFVGSVSETYWDSALARAIRREPAGTFRAIGEAVFSVRADRAAVLPQSAANRVAARLGATTELF